MNAAQKKVAELILHPEQACVVRADGGVEQLSGIGAISVDGGQYVPGDGRFTVGYRSPEVVGVVLLDGRRQKFTGARVVLIKGGRGRGEKQDVLGALSKRLVVSDEGVGLGQIDNVMADSPYIGEIEKYLEDKAKAGAEVGGDEFRTRVQMLKNDVSALNQEAPFTRDNPSSLINGVLGNQITITPPGENTGAPIYSSLQLVARWNGNDVDTREVTCVFGPVGDPPIVSTPAIGNIPRGVQPVGIVQYGTSGYLITAEVDIATGAQFTVAGSSVLLSVKVAGAKVPVSVIGMISMNVCRSRPLTRTLLWNDLGRTAQTGAIRIPSFARSVFVYRFDFVNETVPAFTLDIENLQEEIIYRSTAVVNAAFNGGEPLALSGDAYFMRITNNNVPNPGPTNYGLIFEIAL